MTAVIGLLPQASLAFQGRTVPGAGARNAAAASAFDRVELQDGSSLSGLGLGSDGSEIYFAVRRGWMESHDRNVASRSERLAAEERTAYEQLKSRLDDLITSRPDAPERFLWEQEQTRAEAWLSEAAPAKSEFVLLILPREKVKKVDLADRQWGALVWWAWDKQIDAPEERPVSSLKSALQQLGVDLRGEPPDLGQRFQAIPQSEEEWAARLALVRYSRSNPIDFQGTKDRMLRVKAGESPDLAKLLGQTMQSSTQGLLDELLGPGGRDPRSSPRSDWIELASQQLQGAEEDCFRATVMDWQSLDQSVAVESVFVVRMPDGHWQVIWRTHIDADIRSVADSDVKRLQEDPQIRSLQGWLSVLGLTDDGALDTALRGGAATKQALDQANGRFELFRQRFQHRLDLPILRWDP